MNTNPGEQINLVPHWRHVAAFLGLTFGLTWLLDLGIWLRGGLRIPGLALFTQLQTLLPAFSAIVLRWLFFRESPIYRRRPIGRARWFFYYFLLASAIYAVATLYAFMVPAQRRITLATALLQVLIILGFLLLVVQRFAAGRDATARVWLSWGPLRLWLLFGLGFVLFYVLQVALNAALGLSAARAALPASRSPLLVGIAGVQTVLVTPLLAIMIFFGEEYGWRGYLQSELFKLGRIRGVLLLGLIWGAWHWPVILMGANYPGHPLMGVLLMTLYSTGNAIGLGYAVLRSRSVLLAAYLHGITDQIINFIVALGFRPNDPAFAFGIGIYGIAMLAVICLFILRDPIWRGAGSTLS